MAWCRFCEGAGCLSCDTIKPKQQEDERMKPIFTAQRDNPEDMEALTRIIGPLALGHAYNPDGRGIAEINENAALESLKQILRSNCLEKGEK